MTYFDNVYNEFSRLCEKYNVNHPKESRGEIGKLYKYLCRADPFIFNPKKAKGVKLSRLTLGELIRNEILKDGYDIDIVDVPLSKVDPEDIKGIPYDNYHKCKVLYIDAWRDACGGWQWNDASLIEDGVMIAEDSSILSSSRAFTKWMRDNGFLSEESKGKVRVDMGNDIMDGVLIVVESKSTGEPIMALSSIH